MTTNRMLGRLAATALAGVLLSACGAAQPRDTATGDPRGAEQNAGSAAGREVAVSDPDPPGRAAATQSSIEKDVATAEHLYYNELNGERVHHDLQFVSGDRALVELLGQGKYAAAQTVARRLMVGNPIRHITRISFVRGGRERINATWNKNGSFVSAPLEGPVTYRGHAIGTLLVSVQDIIGFVKLVTRYTPAQAVVRGASGQVRTSLPPAEDVTLPSSGAVTVGGISYLVGSFNTYSWGRNPGKEPMTVWVLEPT
jgi:hypothetical protein